jgi:hypothetical protein
VLDACREANPEAGRPAISKTARQALTKEILAINREHMTHAAQEERLQARCLADTKQKLTNQMATGTYKSQNRMELKYVEDEENNNAIVTGPATVAAIHKYITKRAAAPGDRTHHQSAPGSTPLPQPMPFVAPMQLTISPWNNRHQPLTPC